MTLLLLLLLMMMMKHSEPLLVYRAGAPWFLIRGLGGGGWAGRCFRPSGQIPRGCEHVRFGF